MFFFSLEEQPNLDPFPTCQEDKL